MGQKAAWQRPRGRRASQRSTLGAATMSSFRSCQDFEWNSVLLFSHTHPRPCQIILFLPIPHHQPPSLTRPCIEVVSTSLEVVGPATLPLCAMGCSYGHSPQPYPFSHPLLTPNWLPSEEDSMAPMCLKTICCVVVWMRTTSTGSYIKYLVRS